MSTATTRRVTINPNVKVHDILSKYDYTACEISASWYDAEEMDKITERCFKILQKHEQGSQRGNSKYCMRGLECHTTSGSISKRSNKSEAKAAVFEEQERQSWDAENERSNAQAISDAYQRISSSCQMWAQVVGKRDQQAAEAYQYEEEEDKNDEEEMTLAPQVGYSSERQTHKSLNRESNAIGEPTATAVVSARAA